MTDNATEILDLLDRCKPSLRQLLEELVQGQRDFLRVQQNILHLLKVLTENNGIIIQNQEKIMAGVDDLKQAVADVAAEITSASTDISTEITAVEAAIAKLQQGGGLSDADAAALAAQLQGSVTNLKTAQGTLDAETTKLSGI